MLRKTGMETSEGLRANCGNGSWKGGDDVAISDEDVNVESP